MKRLSAEILNTIVVIIRGSLVAMNTSQTQAFLKIIQYCFDLVEIFGAFHNSVRCQNFSFHVIGDCAERRGEFEGQGMGANRCTILRRTYNASLLRITRSRKVQ
jgi:hypothetical protein